MAQYDPPLLTSVYIQPDRLADLNELQWDLLIRQARSSNLLGRISVMVRQLGCMDRIPERIQAHLESESKYYQAHKASVFWEIEHIQKTFQTMDCPLVLLKGAAYLKSGLEAGKGRIFHDIDILVPVDRIEEAEVRLYESGWVTTHHNEYDQMYYRKWMHELPPLKHYTRKTVLDVHHNILPVTASSTPDSKKLMDNIVAINNDRMLYMLSPQDMIIHSATHLFHEGELDHGLRDLIDIDLLINEFDSDEFWNQLAARALELGLVWPVYYALYFRRKILLRPAPEDILKQLEDALDIFQGSKLVKLAYYHAFLPAHPSCYRRTSRMAMWFLYIRGHKLRMPIHLLIPHLVRKAFMKETAGQQ